MTIYFGSSEKLKIIFNNTFCCANLSTSMLSAKKSKLLSADEYILTDRNGVILMIEEDK